jgi:hypothetical protein
MINWLIIFRIIIGAKLEIDHKLPNRRLRWAVNCRLMINWLIIFRIIIGAKLEIDHKFYRREIGD